MRTLRRGGRWRSEVGGHGIDVVVPGVEGHGSCAALRRDCLDYGEFVRRVFMRDRDRAVAAGGERHASRGVEAICIYPLADRDGRNHSPIGVIDHRHHLIVAANKEALVLDVNRQAGGFLAGSQGPGVQHFQGLRIERDELTLVLDVHVDVSVAIGLCKLRLASEWDAAHNFARAGVDCAGVFSAATVETECEV
jgi:hypothetical protein